MPALTSALIILTIISIMLVFVAAIRLQTDGFTPMSHSYEPTEFAFVPEGYNDLGQFRGFGPMPAVYRQINVGGIPRDALREMYPVGDQFNLIT